MVLLSVWHPLSVSRLLVLLLGTRYIDMKKPYRYAFESRYRYVSIKSCTTSCAGWKMPLTHLLPEINFKQMADLCIFNGKPLTCWREFGQNPTLCLSLQDGGASSTYLAKLRIFLLLQFSIKVSFFFTCFSIWFTVIVMYLCKSVA